MLHSLRECGIPFLENSPGMFQDALGYCSPCPAGEKWSTAANLCVLDTNIDVNPPASTSSNWWLYAIMGILVLGAFAGGRASSGGGVSPGTRKRVTKSFWVTF